MWPIVIFSSFRLKRIRLFSSYCCDLLHMLNCLKETGNCYQFTAVFLKLNMPSAWCVVFSLIVACLFTSA